MPKHFEYTTLAHRYTARFPAITYVGTQINFWILSNVLLVVIIRLYSHVLNESSARQVPENFNTTWIIAILLGITYGIGLGLSGYYLERNIFKKLSLGKILLYKTFVSLGVLILMFAIFRFVLFDLFIAPSLMKEAFKLN